MHKRLLLILLILALAQPVLAQEEVTPDAPIEVIVVTPVPQEGVTVVEDASGDTTITVVTPPAAEADEGMPESVQVAIVIAIAGVLGVGMLAYATSQGKTPQQLYWGLPPAVTQYGLPTVWEAAYRQARMTESTADDQALIGLALLLGYNTETLTDGRIVLTRGTAAPPVPPASG
jgi:hypothetical protein